jgi:hypothetical protein
LESVNIDFDEDVYALVSQDKERLSGNPKIRAMAEIDGIIRNCMIDNFDYGKLYRMTGNNMSYIRYDYVGEKWSDKLQKYRLRWKKYIDYISPPEQTKFSTNWNRFLIEGDHFDYTRMLEDTYNLKLLPPVDYLFLDEFQDFTLLQFKIYENWRYSEEAEKIWLAADDLQSIYRFDGGSAKYMIETPCDEKIILPKTFRHGKEIFENAQKYAKKIKVKEPCDVAPADIEGEVIDCYGDEWLNPEFLSFKDDESVLVLAPTDEWANQLKKEITDFLKERNQNVYFAKLGDMRKVERVFRMYNTIAALERGESVCWDWDGDGDGKKSKFELEFGSELDYAPIKSFFVSSTPLPTSVIVDCPALELDCFDRNGEEKVLSSKLVKKKKKILKSVKSSIRKGNFGPRPEYDKDTFSEDFLIDSWGGSLLVRNIPDIVLFPDLLDSFPQYLIPTVKKQAGTIHKAKGMEADTVFLGMAVPYPILDHVKEVEVQDDLMRLFHVGTSRAKYKLIQIYEYLKYSSGGMAPAPMDVAP